MTLVITGDDLRTRRKARDLTQAALADMLGVKAASVGQWETGVTKPGWRMAQKLEEIFEGVTPAESSRIDRLEAEFEAMRQKLSGLESLVMRLGKSFPPPDE